MSFKVGDKVVIIDDSCSSFMDKDIRKNGAILTIRQINHYVVNNNKWQVHFEEGFGADFKHIRLATPLDEVLE